MLDISFHDCRNQELHRQQYLYCTRMFLEGAAPAKAVLFHRKTFSNCADVTESSHRNYLILLSQFSDNLNASIKHIQNCIPDLQEHAKFKISRNEKNLLSSGLQYLYEENVDRLCRESFYRNAVIRRDYRGFLDNYSLWYSKVQRKEYQKVKQFHCRSFYQKQQKIQRISSKNQTSAKLQRFYSKKQTTQPKVLTKPLTFQLNLSAKLQKHNFEGSKVLSTKKARIRINQSTNLTKSTEDKINYDFEVKGDHVVVSQFIMKNELDNWQLQKDMRSPVQKFSTNRVLAFRNKISTNPEQEQSFQTKPNNVLRHLLKIQNSTNHRKVIKTFQQRIKLIVNTDN